MKASGMKEPRTLEQPLGSYSGEVRTLALGARILLRNWLPGVGETVDSRAPVIGYGYGAGYRGTVCTPILSKSGVKLGLALGAELEHPRGLLEGSGKLHRYVQLQTASDLRRAGVSQLVRAAYAAWRARNRASP